MRKISVVLSTLVVLLATLAVQAAAAPIIWKVDPVLEYDDIQFFHSIYDWEDNAGSNFIGYTSDRMFFIDEKTGGVLQETYPTGGFRDPFSYGFYPETDEFFYNEEYEFEPEEKDLVMRKSQNTAICVYEVERVFSDYPDPDYPDYFWYESKGEGMPKCAIYFNGGFVSDFVYDDVIGGNSIAFVRQNDKYAFADSAGNLITEFVYDDVAEIAKGYVAVKKGSAWGFADASGKEVIPFIFEDAVNIDADTAFVKHNGKYGILDVKKTADA